MNDHLEFLHLFLRFAFAPYRKKKHGKKKMSIVEEDEEDSGITIKVKFIHHQKKKYIYAIHLFLHIIAPQILSLGVKRNLEQSLEHPFSHDYCFTQNRKYVILHSALTNYSISTKMWLFYPKFYHFVVIL